MRVDAKLRLDRWGRSWADEVALETRIVLNHLL